MIVPPARSAITLVPGERFFLKEVTLDPAVGVAMQVELALEESSPFPLAQLYHGFVVSPDRQRALGFAAYRRRFVEEEMAEWSGAAAVLPEFLGLIGPPPDRPLIVVQVDAAGLNGVAWDGRASLPIAIMSRSLPGLAESHVVEMVAELRQRAGAGEIEVRHLDGPVGVGTDAAGGAVFRIAGEQTALFPAAALSDADVRDKSFLDEKRRDSRRRRGWAWVLTGVGVLWLVALGLELALGGLGLWNQRRQSLVTKQAAAVRRIETAQTLATRIEDLGVRQERPLEWLLLVSSMRPRSIQFTRVVSNNDRTLAIDAQTAEAAAVGAYELALRHRDEIAQVEMRDIRSREGLTSFVLFLKFKPGSPPVGEGRL